MATRADQFKARVEKEHRRAKARQRKVKPSSGHTGIVARATYSLETTADGRAKTKPQRGKPVAASKVSRKSTRSASNRMKTDSELHRQKIREVRSPKARAAAER